jgi:hypothetical protein
MGTLVVMMRTALVVVLATVIGSCGGGEPAKSRQLIGGRSIAINRGLAGVSLGMPASAVRRQLGAPDATQSVGVGENGDSASVWTYRLQHVTVEIASFGVARVETNSRQIRTPGGLGVGSTQGEVARGLELSCAPSDVHVWCTTGVPGIGDPQTIFVIGHGRVSLVRIVTVTP